MRADGKPGNDGSAVCRSCWKRVITKHRNTSYLILLAHLRTNHPALHTQAKAAMEGSGKQPARKATPAPPTSSQPMLQESITMQVAYEWRSTKWKELTVAVTYFIAKDSLPTYTVEKGASSSWCGHLIPATNCLLALTSLEQPFLLCTSQ